MSYKLLVSHPVDADELSPSTGSAITGDKRHRIWAVATCQPFLNVKWIIVVQCRKCIDFDTTGSNTFTWAGYWGIHSGADWLLNCLFKSLPPVCIGQFATHPPDGISRLLRQMLPRPIPFAARLESETQTPNNNRVQQLNIACADRSPPRAI